MSCGHISWSFTLIPTLYYKCKNNISKLCFNLNEETKIPYSGYTKHKGKNEVSKRISRLYELYNYDVVFSSNYESWVLGAQDEYQREISQIRLNEDIRIIYTNSSYQVRQKLMQVFKR